MSRELSQERMLARVPEIAAFLSLSRSKVYQMMDAGELPYVKLGKSRRVRWSDVMALIAANTVGRDGPKI
jgi:excisionase family DNA binding protein